MEISSAALVSLFIGMGWALIRVVEFFIKKYSKNGKTCLTEEQNKMLYEVYTSIVKSDLNNMLKKQEEMLDNIHKLIEHLDDLHSVYDENHVPKWYFPKEILQLSRSIFNEVKILDDEISGEISRMSAGQSIMVDKISDLINSQKLVTEKLNDLIILWTKLVQK
jgi:hypothetical protein